MLRTTVVSPIEPSLLTTNLTTTRPFNFSFTALSGYLMFWVSQFINSVVPPGNSGIFSDWFNTSLVLLFDVLAPFSVM